MTNLLSTLNYEPSELNFGTSGLRGLVTDMTDLECYINTRGFITFLEEHEGKKPDTIYVGGDLRPSTPRIMASVHRAAIDAGCEGVNMGTLPTPALANYSFSRKSPSIMVTGSHIPADRNGVKFYKSNGEVLKEDEAAIKSAVAKIRSQVYASDATASASLFDSSGQFKQPASLPQPSAEAVCRFTERYTNTFSSALLKGKHIVVYQHSSVGRDLLVDICAKLGAKVTPVDRSETFIPIDTENVTPENQRYFKALADSYPDTFAIISTDGDADRPFIVDEKGIFHRGDTVGAIVAEWLRADAVALPISSSDAIEAYIGKQPGYLMYTKIGSPYVISAIDHFLAAGKQRVMGWEVNGGFLLGSSLSVAEGMLEALPTRDSFLPILGVLSAAIEKNMALSEMFAQLPARFTSAGVADNFPTETAANIITSFANDNEHTRRELEKLFSEEQGFGYIHKINTLDGLRIFFENGDIAHLRPSGNAPQLRLYSVADTPERADEIVQIALKEPGGIFQLLKERFG